MEFLDEDTRPRFLFQSGSQPPPSSADEQSYNKPTKTILIVTVSVSAILLFLSIFYLQSEPFKSLLLWLALSLLLGPFAPPSLTAGDIRVGQGSILEFPDQQTLSEDDDNKKNYQRRSKSRRSDEVQSVAAVVAPVVKSPEREAEKIRVIGNGNGVVSEKEWSEEDVEILKKQMTKHPVGKPGRWEAIAAAFGGRHGAESVIKKAKELAEKKVDDSESYAQFLKKRKPVDKRVVEEAAEEENNGASAAIGDGAWSSGEDIALLNALKAFPKEAPMRWEKVAAAVPGKSKGACMKRVTELKKGFRNAKAASADKVE
ncbi:hypothetical protein PIB30_035880 [Stylosanthes scabra]|uniref:Myb-like domain-containing protein n=1 Tax=Stylosanthes scabra TaxID=79078 RepID=A0ABU6UDT8_9FABA|nr:hypothetical protein [Stylosanthes scabra]